MYIETITELQYQVLGIYTEEGTRYLVHGSMHLCYGSMIVFSSARPASSWRWRDVRLILHINTCSGYFLATNWHQKEPSLHLPPAEKS